MNVVDTCELIYCLVDNIKNNYYAKFNDKQKKEFHWLIGTLIQQRCSQSYKQSWIGVVDYDWIVSSRNFVRR